jgi:hypothetical protein
MQAQVGGYGLLYSLRANEQLFRKPQVSTKKTDDSEVGPRLIQIR